MPATARSKNGNRDGIDVVFPGQLKKFLLGGASGGQNGPLGCVADHKSRKNAEKRAAFCSFEICASATSSVGVANSFGDGVASSQVDHSGRHQFGHGVERPGI